MFELKWIFATYEWKVVRHLYFAILFSISSDQHIWYIYILRVMRCWVTLTMTCIILFCLPCYSIPRSNCSFKNFLILTPEWNVGASGAAESNIFFHCIRFKITFLSELNSNIIPFTEQWFATLLYGFFNNKIIKIDEYRKFFQYRYAKNWSLYIISSM